MDNYITATIVGDSMCDPHAAHSFADSETILVDTARRPKSGDHIVVCRPNGLWLFGQLQDDNGVRVLKMLNPPGSVSMTQSMKVLGVCVGKYVWEGV